MSPAEEVLFAELARSRRGAKTLDLGVGAGRTTPALLAASRDYLGLDYSPGMVEACKRKFPGAAFEVGDARRLESLPEGAFDAVVFSFNGLDYSGHEDRRVILRGVARLLKPGGEFIFSSHNRSMEGYDRFPLPLPPLDARAPLGFARLLAGLARHALNRRHEVRTPDYAIINEPELGYRLMTYYVTVEEQERQLRAAGFRGVLEVYDAAGRKVASDATSRALYYRVFKD